MTFKVGQFLSPVTPNKTPKLRLKGYQHLSPLEIRKCELPFAQYGLHFESSKKQLFYACTAPTTVWWQAHTFQPPIPVHATILSSFGIVLYNLHCLRFQLLFTRQMCRKNINKLLCIRTFPFSWWNSCLAATIRINDSESTYRWRLEFPWALSRPQESTPRSLVNDSSLIKHMLSSFLVLAGKIF
jgi:hypothetical protein